MRVTSTRAAITVAGTAITAAVMLVSPAHATSRAATGGSLSVTSARWGAAGAPVGGSPVIGASYVLTWNLPNIGVNYFQIANTGTLALTAQSYTTVNSKPTNGTVPPTIAIDGCVGAAWNTTAGTCAGTVVRLATSTQTQATTTTAAPIPAGGALSVRAAPITLPNFPQTYQTTISISVDRSQVRAGATTNS